MSCRAMLLSAGGLLATSMALSPMLAAPGLKNEAKPEANTSVEAIRKALDATNNFEFKDQNLSAILNTISEQYKIQIVLDKATLNMMGIMPEEMNVELSMKNTKLRSALRALVGQYNLTFAIFEGQLLITTEENLVQRQFKQRIDVNYDNVPLQTATKDLTSKYGVSIVFDPKTIKAKTSLNPVSLQVDDVALEAAVRMMADMADLKPVRMGNVIYITSEAKADKLKDGDTLVPPLRNPFQPGMPGFVPGAFGGNLGFAGGGPNVVVPGVVPPAVGGVEAIPPKESKDAPAKEDTPAKEAPAKDTPAKKAPAREQAATSTASPETPKAK